MGQWGMDLEERGVNKIKIHCMKFSELIKILHSRDIIRKNKKKKGGALINLI